ncbi:hypothetical protein AWC38_SpisGene25238, partial [Stylophora pistillata]
IWTMDDGEHWMLLAEKVLRYHWAPNQRGGKSELLLEVATDYDSVLKHAFLPCTNTKECVKDFDKNLGTFAAHSLKVEGKYVFVE